MVKANMTHREQNIKPLTNKLLYDITPVNIISLSEQLQYTSSYKVRTKTSIFDARIHLISNV